LFECPSKYLETHSAKLIQIRVKQWMNCNGLFHQIFVEDLGSNIMYIRVAPATATVGASATSFAYQSARYKPSNQIGFVALNCLYAYWWHKSFLLLGKPGIIFLWFMARQPLCQIKIPSKQPHFIWSYPSS
jgi:hypothetical protein